ncbi:hypothetical protein BGZ82_002424, partial [Podila clonocystis]
AVDIVVDRTRRDLRRSSKGVIGQADPPLAHPAYQFPYHTVTQANIEHVIDRGFLGSYVDHAKHLTRFLEGVLKKDERKKSKGKRLSEDKDRNGNKDHNDHKHKDDGKDVAEDEESEVGEDVEEEEDIEKEENAKEEDVEIMDFVDMVESHKIVRMAQTVEADSDAELEDTVKVEDKVKGKNDAETHRRPHRNPVSVRGCVAAMLLFMTSQKCNAFQTVMGVFLHCTGCPTRVLDILSSFGLSVSDDQVRKALANMTKDTQNQVKKAVLNNDWFVIYDNINIAMKHHHQRINKLDTFDNGTAATIILIHPEEDYEKAGHDQKSEHGETSEHDERSLDDESNSDDEIDTDDESDTNDGSSAEHDEVDESDKAKDHHPSIVVFRPDRLVVVPSASIFFPNAADRTLFRTVCHHHFSSVIAQSPTCIVPIVEVDPLPIQKSIAFPLQTMKIDESTIASNLSVLETIIDVGLGLAKTWFARLPNIIVAGDQMTVARLLSLWIHRAIDPDPFGSLSWVHPVPQLFHMRMTLCGTIFRTHYGDANTRGSLGSFITQLHRKNLTKDGLNFKAADELLRIVFEALVLVLVDFFKPHIGASDELDIPRVIDSIIDTLASLGTLMKSHSPMILDRPCTAADINALLLLRDVAVYIELGNAINVGGNTNYARELLRLLYGMRHIWMVEWERRVLSSMLVNPKGIAGRWMATDMYQETNNYLLKAIFAAKGPNMSWEYLRDYVSTNIRAFQEIAQMFERAVGARLHDPAHVRSSSEGDVYKVKNALQESGILTWEPSDDKRALPDLVVDLQCEGGDKMAGGALDKFLTSKIDHNGAAELEETEATALMEHAD